MFDQRTVKRILEYMRMILGTMMMAMAVNLVFEPMGMVTGGVSGLAIVVKQISGLYFSLEIPVWITNFALNIPIFAGAFLLQGRRYVLRAFFANAMFTAMLYIIPVLPVAETDYVLAVVAGGVLNGLGLGLVFSVGASTGGTDLLSVIVHHFLPHYTMANLLFVIDSAVILTGALIFGIPSAIYASICVYLSSRIMDGIIEGMHFAKGILIFSDFYEEIGKEVMERMGRGVTLLDGSGMYTGKQKKILLCIVSRKEITRVTKIVQKKDENSFVIISDIRQVFGEGFVKNRQ